MIRFFYLIFKILFLVHKICYNVIMKRLKFSIIDCIILGILISSLTLDIFWNFLTSIFDVILLTNKLSNPYSFTKFLTENSTMLCKIVWINKILFLIAGFIPSIILRFALNDTSIPNWLNWILCGLLYYLVLQIFSSPITWIIIGIAVISYISYKLIIYIKNKKAINEKKV